MDNPNRDQANNAAVDEPLPLPKALARRVSREKVYVAIPNDDNRNGGYNVVLCNNVIVPYEKAGDDYCSYHRLDDTLVGDDSHADVDWGLGAEKGNEAVKCLALSTQHPYCQDRRADTAYWADDLRSPCKTYYGKAFRAWVLKRNNMCSRSNQTVQWRKTESTCFIKVVSITERRKSSSKPFLGENPFSEFASMQLLHFIKDSNVQSDRRHIVEQYDLLFEDKTNIYCVMPVYEGELLEFIPPNGKFPINQVKTIISQILKGLQFMHAMVSPYRVVQLDTSN